MDPKFPLAAITDEFTPDLERALEAMTEIGMSGAELRVLWGKNVVDLSDEEVDRARELVASRGLQVISIASPLLKCVLPGAPEVDSRWQQDVFASRHTYEDQPRLAERAIAIANRTGAGLIRVFSYWRSVAPEKCFDAVVAALEALAGLAARHGVIIGLENEQACNIATAAEAARLLRAVDHPNLKLVWDPCNALVAGQSPFPEGYRLLPPERIVHVHAKDCRIVDGKPVFGPLGTAAVDWKGQIAALRADGYKGYISLETHWPGPAGDKYRASVICGWNLRGLAAA